MEPVSRKFSNGSGAKALLVDPNFLKPEHAHTDHFRPNMQPQRNSAPSLWEWRTLKKNDNMSVLVDDPTVFCDSATGTNSACRNDAKFARENNFFLALFNLRTAA